MPRAYDNTTRSAQAARTAERIATYTEALLLESGVGALTLQAIAAGAGVTVQTVLRHMGSRDGCIDAVRQRIGARVDAQRGQSEPGDVAGAIAGLLEHYETEGALVLRLLSLEDRDDDTRAAVEDGRAYHRDWVERCFEVDELEQVDALVAATDLYVWKLMRLDLGRSEAATSAVITRLVRAVLETP